MTTRENPGEIRTYEEAEGLYRPAGYAPIPVGPDKRPTVKGWTRLALSDDEIADRIHRHGKDNVGLLAGTALGKGMVLGFVDIDHEAVVAVVCAFLGAYATAKKGAKGLTIVCRAEKGSKSVKIHRGDKSGKPLVEFFLNSGMVVIPDSLHPQGMRYQWIGKPLLQTQPEDHPVVTKSQIDILKAVLGNENAWTILEGGAGVGGHEPMLKLTSSGIADMTDDLPWLAGCLGALFDPAYGGDTKEEILELLESAKSKGLGSSRKGAVDYEPGEVGPLPLGYTRDGLYALLDPVRQIIVLYSANQLLTAFSLMGLAPSEFWVAQFPAKKTGFNAIDAGESLMAACRSNGAFIPSRVRGRGVWLEGDTVVLNFGGAVHSDVHRYLCFERIALDQDQTIDPARVLAFLERFRWRNPLSAKLLFGWLVIAVICGALRWRPHVFIYGPARSGKTTIHGVASHLLTPLVVAADGQSTEAGIRQTLGPDSLPVIIDEFESDQNGGSLRNILRLARSASSAEVAVLKGTPEGKAMTFSLRTAFLFAAINPRGMSAADQSRITMLELMMHENDRETAALLAAEEVHFRSLGHAWCSHMVTLAPLVQPAIDMIEKAIVAVDRRLRQNMSTMLAGGFVALHGRVPTEEEARDLACEFEATIGEHAVEGERDDARECLEHLLGHMVDRYPLGHWIAAERHRLSGGNEVRIESQRIVAAYNMLVRVSGENAGLLLQNGSPMIEKIFEGTVWSGMAWRRALLKLEGAFTPKDPVQFALSGKKRCVGIVLDDVPEDPLPMISGDEKFGTKF